LLPKFSLRKKIDELNGTLGEALLAVHRSYLKPIQKLTSKNLVNGMSHITGGGIAGNTMRIIPKGLKLHIDWLAWQRPYIYDFIQSVGKVPEYDMTRAFNLGIGLIFVVSVNNVDAVIKNLRQILENPVIIGTVQ
jgi:phosphoribosylformylglycinamidine cyclo-ligase